ncbi:MAG: hypothetical protein OXP73_12735 [Chloroflexota bacterium]|nr:hypothetical protein [Chloroflexota bacterium]
MPKSWQDEVKEILDRAEASAPPPKRRVVRAPQPNRRRRNYVELLGRWIMSRVSTTGEMLVTAAVLVVVALFLSIFLRQFASIVAVAGAVVFAAALVRGIMERRSARSPGSRGSPVMWRGRVIELPDQRPSLRQRLRDVLRRRR